MPSQQVSLEDSVRRLSEFRWPTRKIARQLRISQSTVVRIQKRINTGPDPILPARAGIPGTGAARLPVSRLPGSRLAMAVLIIAVVVLAAVAAVALWLRVLDPPAPVQVTACIRFSDAGNVTGIAASGAGSCPPHWTAITLPAASGG